MASWWDSEILCLDGNLKLWHPLSVTTRGSGVSDRQAAENIFVQLTVARLPATLLPTAVGLFVGYLYRSDVLQLKSWRIPPR